MARCAKCEAENQPDQSLPCAIHGVDDPDRAHKKLRQIMAAKEVLRTVYNLADARHTDNTSCVAEIAAETNAALTELEEALGVAKGALGGYFNDSGVMA